MKALADMIVFSDDWGRHPSSCQHLMKRFLPYNRLLWVNSIGLRTPTFSLYDIKRAFQKLGDWKQPTQNLEKNLTLTSPISFPWNQFGFIRSLNKQLGLSNIERSLKKKEFGKRISLTTVPNACDWIGNLGESLKIYYCVDDFSEWPGMNRRTILEMEKTLLSKIDLFVATSEHLLETKSPKGIPSLFLPHGVDLEHFRKASLPIIKDERELPFPTIGYFGSLDKRIDFELIDFVADQRPNWNWLFMGPHQYFPDSLRKKENIFVRPSVDYEYLPEALRTLDIICLPYKSSELSQSLNPLKLRECLATGKPVVSTSMPEIDRYKDVLFIAESRAEILDQLERRILEYSDWKSEKQLDRITPETWETRASTLAERIEELL